ncbi:sugar transferase [Tellurirhabdus rosea]|uniref:sugar transferase n=1 Tax=Tellurirhabdus rosea TaxID=2674997 RepID=UPI002256AC0E|nr:sugar transferase [Tellurirhabdus rosea]
MIDLVRPESVYYASGKVDAARPFPATKRVFDLLFAFLVSLFVLSWLIPLIGLLIRLESRGPILFVQMRTGRNNRPFPCLKFRTMRFDLKAEFKQAQKNDPRVTRIGAFLRKTNLDEMPQFLNVLAGHMSIVGPRPHAIQHDAQFFHRIDNYSNRYSTKPGITGVAQTRGHRGETCLQDMQHRVRLDLWYIRNQSLGLDLKICWWTVAKMLKGDEKAW